VIPPGRLAKGGCTVTSTDRQDEELATLRTALAEKALAEKGLLLKEVLLRASRATHA
jgi:hypothetical protein